jgi:hypothetical protein
VTLVCPLCGGKHTERREAPAVVVPADDYCSARQCQWTKALEETHPDWPRPICLSIARHELILGMTGEQVMESRGKAWNADRMVTKHGIITWWSRIGRDWGIMLLFEGNRLASIQEW